MKKKLLLLLSLGLISSGAGYYWLFYTNSGLQFVLARASSFIPNNFSYHTVEGSIASGIVLQSVQYRDSEIKITIDQIQFSLQPLRLLNGQLYLGDINGKTVNLDLLSTTAATVNTDPSSKTQQQNGDSNSLLPLPLDFLFSDIQIETFKVMYGDTSSLEFDNINATRIVIDRVLKTEMLTFNWNQNQYELQGILPVSVESPIALTTSFQYAVEDPRQSIAGKAELSGTLNQMTIAGQLNAPITLTYQGVLSGLLDEPSWDVNLQAEKIDSGVWMSGQASQLTHFVLHSSGTPNHYSINGSTGINQFISQDWNCNFALEKIAQQWNIVQVKLIDATSGQNISLQGQVDSDYIIDKNTPLKLHAEWTGLHYPVSTEFLLASQQGQFNFNGNVNQYNLEATLDLQTGDHHFDNLKINGSGSLNNFHAQQISGLYLAGGWEGTASVDWQPNWKWQATMQAKNVDLHDLFPDWNSQLSGKLEHTGEINGDNLVIDVSSKRITGKIHKRNIVASGSVHFANQHLLANNIAIQAQGASLKGNADFDFGEKATFPLDQAKWTVDIDDLAAFNPSMKGTVHSAGNYHRSEKQLNMNAKLDAQNIHYKNISIQTLMGNGNFIPDNHKTSTATIQADGIKINEQNIESVVLHANGTQPDHVVDLLAKISPNASIQVKANGHQVESHWQGDIHDINILTKDARWQQKKTAALNEQNLPRLYIDEKNISLSNICLSGTASHDDFCLSINKYNPATVDGKVSIASLSLKHLNTLLPTDVKIENGALAGDITVHYVNEQFTINAQLGSTQGIIKTNTMPDKVTLLNYSDMHINVATRNNAVNIKAATTITDAGKIGAELMFPTDILSKDITTSQIQGVINVDLNTLDIISMLVPDLAQPKGGWQSRFELGGTIKNPSLQGESTIVMSTVLVPRAGIELKDLKLLTLANPNGSLELKGSTNSLTGHLTIDGAIDDYRSDTLQGKLHIKGTQFKLIKLPETEVSISPDLSFILDKNKVTLSGVMTINQADINIFSPTSRITPSSDVVIVNEKPSTSVFPPVALTGDVRINLEDKIWLRGYGFQGRLKGSILVHERPNELTNATGEIVIVEGKYNAYNQDLTIESGSLSYAGNPIDNPNVRIRAVRKTSNEVVTGSTSSEVVAGLTVTGPAQSPTIQLFSEPPMDEAEILAYIILGYPIKQATQKDGSILANAAASIGLASGEKLVKKIATKFGIDEVKLQSSNTTKEASLILGKYLSPQLYLRYAYGIGQAVNTLQLQYQLTDKWSIKTESGQTQSTDILFSIEK